MILTLSFAFSLTACSQKEDFSSLVFTDAVYEYDGKKYNANNKYKRFI